MVGTQAMCPHARVLVVDDDPGVRELLDELLQGYGFEVRTACDLGDLRVEMATGPEPDVVLLDLKFPDGSGMDIIPAIKTRWPLTEVIVLTCLGTIETAVEAVRRGAFHLRLKPFQTDDLLRLIGEACRHRDGSRRAGEACKRVPRLAGGMYPVFKSEAMRGLLRKIERVAPSEAAVMIMGESGTGKEVVADLVHALSRRSAGPFVKVNCAALPHSLIESELFGVVRGAYTGAHMDREGLFSQATGGTILLDEITEMPMEMQAKLLRVLQERRYRSVGGRDMQLADCRLVTASNRPIDQAIREQKIRSDLFYRISTITLALPPLRERTPDILPLSRLFLRRYGEQAGRGFLSLTRAAAELLERHDWPGNVRQLENTIQRAVLVAETDQIEVHDLGLGNHEEMVNDLAEPGELRCMEREAILDALRMCHGNKAAAATRLGVARQTLYNKLRGYGLEEPSLSC